VQQRCKENFQTGKTALHIAAEKGQSSTVRLLLNLNSKISAQDQLGRTALHLAVYNSHLKAAEELLKVATLDLQILDSTGRAPLHAAVASGNRELVLSLLGAGADIECEDSLGRTAFHLAALAGSDDMIRLLSDRGANINSVINQSVVSGSRTQ
jgi:ankyrin repeat protein